MPSRLEFSRAVTDQTQIIASWAYFTPVIPPPVAGVFHDVPIERDQVERYLWIAGRRARDGGGQHLLIAEVIFWDDNKRTCTFPVVDVCGYTQADIAQFGFGEGTLANGAPKFTPYVKLDPMLGNNYADITQVGGGTQQPPLLLCCEDGASTNVCRMQCFFLRVRAQRVTYEVKQCVINGGTFPLFTGFGLLSMFP